MNRIIFDRPVNQPESGGADSPFAPWMEKIIVQYQKRGKPPAKQELTISVDQTLSSIALIYEKIRNAVDFKDEHLFRRGAIERILRRRLIALGRNSARKTAASLIKELIWSRYIKNASLPRSLISKTEVAIAKFQLVKNGLSVKEAEWFLGITSAEIDRILVDQRKNDLWAEAATSWFNKNFVWKDRLDGQTKNILIQLAMRRALLKADDPMLEFWLLSQFYPGWTKNEPQTVNQVKAKAGEVIRQVDYLVHHPLRNSLFRFVKKSVPPITVLKDIFNETPPSRLELILTDPKKLDGKIKQICRRHYLQTKDRVQRGIRRSIIYIFATKMVFVLLLEIPFDAWYYHRKAGALGLAASGNIRLLPLSLNLTLPPLLMFLIGLFIHPPSEENTKRIIRLAHQFVYQKEVAKRAFFLIGRKKKFWEVVFGLLYLGLFVAVFGMISSILLKIGFNPASILVFFFFVCLVLLFAFRVRWSAQELLVEKERQGFVESLMSLLLLPFLDVGARLSAGLAKINFWALILDFLIEAPLKTIMEVVSQWLKFIRKRQEEVVEVPFQ
jgi:hypothetical protein